MRVIAVVVATIIAGACGTPAAPPTPAPAGGPGTAPAVPADAVADRARRWIPGDLHVHPAPFDVREGASLTVADVAARARGAGLEWVILTPHVRPATWTDRPARRAWLARWTAMAQEARAQTGVTIIPGTEYTEYGFGHFGVSGVDLATLGDDFLATAAASGAFVVVNHPFAVPSHIPGIPASEMDLSFHPWSDGRGALPHVDGVEVWNLPLALADLLLRDQRMTGESRAFVEADRLARREHRAVAVVGGSDTHSNELAPTTWVLARDPSVASVLAALRAGATCVGGPGAGTLEAHGDADPAGAWAAIGEGARAQARVELRWAGLARLFIDGADAGEHDGGFVDADARRMRTYRLVRGTSRCGFVYANLGP